MEVVGLIIGLAILGAFSYACYKIALRKGRSGPLFAVLGFFLPIAALIAVAIIPPKVGAPPAA